MEQISKLFDEQATEDRILEDQARKAISNWLREMDAEDMLILNDGISEQQRIRSEIAKAQRSAKRKRNRINVGVKIKAAACE